MTREPDAYDVCRHLKRYAEKNGYTMRLCPPELGLLGATRTYLDTLVKNGVVSIVPIIQGGEPVAVLLTDKGRRMANEPVRRRR